MQLVKGGGIYGLFPYTPRIATIRQLPADDRLKQASNFIYNFKKFGRKADQIKAMVEEAAGQLGCGVIVAVPGSGLQENSLQKLFGARIKRTAETASRKYNHTKELAPGYAETYQVNWDGITGGKVLLVDDVCTSGATLRHFCKAFESKGFEAVGLAIGLHYKHIEQPAESGQVDVGAGPVLASPVGNEVVWWMDGADREAIENLKDLGDVFDVCAVDRG